MKNFSTYKKAIASSFLAFLVIGGVPFSIVDAAEERDYTKFEEYDRIGLRDWDGGYEAGKIAGQEAAAKFKTLGNNNESLLQENIQKQGIEDTQKRPDSFSVGYTDGFLAELN